MIWLAAVAGLVVYGATKEKPGIAMAPLVFLALWLVASLVLRCGGQIVDTVGNWHPAVPDNSRGYRTLVVDYWYEMGASLLALNAIDRQVTVNRDNNSNRITDIIETTIGRDCSADELAFSSLRIIGRPDECLKKRHLDAIPDGLVLAYHYNIDVVHGASGCCNEVEISRRMEHRDERLFAWRQGYLRIPAYFPLFYDHYTVTAAHQPGIWQADAGPLQVVRFGAEDIRPETVIAAIYGMGPEASLVRSLPDDRLIDIAEGLAARDQFGEADDALSLIKEAQRRGIVDDRMPKIAAAFVGFDLTAGTDYGSALDPYLKQLDVASARSLLEYLLERITNPGICKKCRESKTAWFGLTKKLDDPAAALARARQIFAKRNDLNGWQYETDLRLIHALLVTHEPKFDSREVVSGLDQAIDYNDARQSKKAEAFRLVFPGSWFRTRRP